MRDVHLELELGDQTGILDPRVTEELVALTRQAIPPDIAGVVVGTTTTEVLIGYLLAKYIGVPAASLANHDGLLQVGGHLPESGPAWLVITILDETAVLGEFAAACHEAGASVGGVIALVNRLPKPEAGVHSLLRWSDYVHDASTCPLGNPQTS